MLSIIIPFYRGEQYLSDCFDGIREGGFEDVEVIVSDDDPVDPRGVAFARNRGFERSRGDFVLFLDSDDYFLPDGIAQAMEETAKDPDAVTVLPLEGTFYSRKAVLGQWVKNPSFKLDIPVLMRVTGLIIPRRYIDSRSFPERFRYYSELSFMAKLFESVRFRQAQGGTYYKRIHNDPVNLPSLSQEDSPMRVKDFCNSMILGAESIGSGNSETMLMLAGAAGSFFEKALTHDNAPAGLANPPRITEEDVPLIEKALGAVGKGTLRGLDNKDEARILGFLSEANLSRARKVAKRIVFKRKKKGLFGSKDQWRLAFYRKVALRMKVKKDLVFFESFNGGLYGDSCRYIYEHYIEHNPANRRFVWSLKRTPESGAKIPGKHRRVTTGGLRYMLALARAGILVSNMRQPSWYVKRPGQMFFETWHGTPLKKLVFDMDDVYTASPGYKKIFYDQSRKWDWLLSGNDYSTDVFEHAFMLPRERIVCLGYPRNDRLRAGADEELKMRMREKLGLPKEKKIILYAPTWRDNRFRGSGDYEMPSAFDRDFYKKAENCFFILRQHYFVGEAVGLTEACGENAVDMSAYDDINDLYLASDMLVTDYSSVFFDYAILGRPMVFYAYDEEEYRDGLRGLYFDMENYCPGPIVRTQDELADVLKKDEEFFAPYLERYKMMGSFFDGPGDGCAAKRVVEFIEDRAGRI